MFKEGLSIGISLLSGARTLFENYSVRILKSGLCLNSEIQTLKMLKSGLCLNSDNTSGVLSGLTGYEGTDQYS